MLACWLAAVAVLACLARAQPANQNSANGFTVRRGQSVRADGQIYFPWYLIYGQVSSERDDAR